MTPVIPKYRPVVGDEVSLLKSIGVVIATYNGERYLQEEIDSIINQSFDLISTSRGLGM